MADLTVADYNKAEESAILTTSINAYEAFQPVYFQRRGYQIRISSESELSKFIDHHHELSFESRLRELQGGLTEQEFLLLKKLTRLVSAFTESRFGYRSVARSNILSSIGILRHIRYLFGDERPSIFEIGPGAGYLGAMLMLESYPYAATDVTQSLYLYQNHLWNFVSGGNVIELAHDYISNDRFPAPTPGGAVHIPWWEYARLQPGQTPQFDVVTCNNCLTEMHRDSLGFTLNIARHFKKDSEGPTFVFKHFGAHLASPLGSVIERFYKTGFVLVHHDDRITVMVPKGSFGYFDPPRPKSRLLRRSRRILRNLIAPNPNPSGNGLHSYDVTQYSSKSNVQSKAIVEARRSELRLVGVEQLNQFYFDLLGG